MIAAGQEESSKEIRGVKTLLLSDSGETNETRLEVVAKELKDEIENKIDHLRHDIEDMKTVLVTNLTTDSECTATNPLELKQAQVSALVCKYTYLVCL